MRMAHLLLHRISRSCSYENVLRKRVLFFDVIGLASKVLCIAMMNFALVHDY